MVKRTPAIVKIMLIAIALVVFATACAQAPARP